MNDYKQPEFFRFGHDSLELVRWIKEHATEASSLLDLGAGSGVIGIELANFFRPQRLTLLEVQSDYLPFLEENIKEQLQVSLDHEIVMSSFGNWSPSAQYDLIVSNPPYYLPGRGQASPDERRELARTFKLDDWRILFGLIRKSLASEGKAFLVIKNDPLILHHLKDFLPEDLILLERDLKDVVILELSRLHED